MAANDVDASKSPPSPPSKPPQPERLTLPLAWLDTLWIQVTGTLCNIACKHCFVSAGPKVDQHKMMSIAQVRKALDDGEGAGMRAVWFTGGEPFLHEDILALVAMTLERAPLGILSNGMLVDESLATALARLAANSEYSLEVRVSLDGRSAAENDRVRGRGVFDAACNGIRLLAKAGLEPIVAVSQLDDSTDADQVLFADLLRGLGVQKPRVKWIPPFRIGREARRRGGRGYHDWETLTADDVADPEAPFRVQCGTSRCVTSEGAFPCPILINEPGYRMGNALGDALRPHPVDHKACHTCWTEAFSCSV